MDEISGIDLKFLQQRNRSDDELGTYDFCVHSIIEEQARNFPDSHAICSWDGLWTYRALDDTATKLAAYLHRSGVGEEVIVPFLFHKSSWTVVAILAILKAGGAPVALDPEIPIKRLEEIVDSTKARIVLAGADLKDKLQTCDPIIIDEILLASLPVPGEPFCATVKPSNLCFVQFTSGSTGKPKGIMIEHRQYCANAFSQHKASYVTASSRVLQFSAHSFDALWVEVLTTLMVGACICIPSEQRRINDLSGAIRELEVTWMGLTPTLAKIINPDDVPSVKTMALWGEPTPKDVIDIWVDRVQLLNVYGPSECSVEVTTNTCWAQSMNPSNIGTPLEAVNVWIGRPDDYHLLCPVGVIGEMIVQGPTVGRGYLNDPIKTGQAFVEDLPWLPVNYGTRYRRAYRTGDLARYMPDGSLEICGRMDAQVKIRGHRIELGEIEYHLNLNSSDSLASAVEVIQSKHSNTQKMLAAFLWSKDSWKYDCNSSSLLPFSESHHEEAVKLSEALSKVLPSIMVPTIYLPLSFIPVLPSGKVNRKMLREIAESLPEEQLRDYNAEFKVFARPLNGDEERLGSIWSVILKIDAAKLISTSNFFWLGGDSILAMRLTVAARQEGLQLSVEDVLHHPRLADQASVLREISSENTQYTHFSTLPQEMTSYFLSHIIPLRLPVDGTEIEDIAKATDYQVENLSWSLLQKRGGTNYITFDFSAPVSPERLQEALEQLIKHHAILRTVYIIHKNQIYQIVLKRLSFNVIQCLHINNVKEETASLMKHDLREPLDPTKALIRCWILRQGMTVKRLILRASHLQYDGVSLIRWCRELGSAYSGKHLDPVTPFADYMHFARENRAEEAREFWRQTLAGSSMTQVFQHSKPPYKKVLDGQVETMIPISNTRSHADVTIGTSIKSAWGLVLAEMSGQTDVVFGSVVWGRNAPFSGVENVSGACIDNIPVRIQFSSSMSVMDLLQQVQQQYFAAVPFECFGYKRIVQECTDWKPWERLSTLVEYENLGEESSEFPFGSGIARVDEIRPPADRHDITIYSMPVADKIFIALDFCTEMVSESVAQFLLERLCFHLRTFGEDVQALLDICPPPDAPRFPLSRKPAITSTDVPITPSYCSGKAMLNRNLDKVNISIDTRTLIRVTSIVQQAWMSTFDCTEDDFRRYNDLDIPLFEVWGNLIAAYELSLVYRRNGFQINMEDVLENPTIGDQVVLLATK